MTRYRIGDEIVQDGDPKLSDLLAAIYHTSGRPLCLCRDGGVPMYVAKIWGKFIIKRMPNTACEHAAMCDSYDPPPELSGLAQVMGSAIRPDLDSGVTELKLGFSLSKGASRAAPAAGENSSETAKTDGSKLSLRGVLHYLWECAGFNRWTPNMRGKRSWHVVHKYLLQAADHVITKGSSLTERLYVPEPFISDKKDDIAQRRMMQFARALHGERGMRKLMLVLAEVKDIVMARYGYKLMLKHVPDCPFMIAEDLYKRILKRFEVELTLWDAQPTSHLIVMGTFDVGRAGVASFDELALMTVTDQWIPLESAYDRMVLDALIHANRRFVKSLRYNLGASRPLACAVVTDVTDCPSALYVIPPGASAAYEKQLDDLIGASQLGAWIWRAAEEMPSLPTRCSNMQPSTASVPNASPLNNNRVG